MAARTEPPAAPAGRTLVVSRVFDAPRELVWRAWSVPEHFVRWWGPKDFTAPTCKMDFRVGGKYLWCMRGPEGKEYWTTGEFREIMPLERLVYTDLFSDEKGNPVSGAHYGLGNDWPMETLVTVVFEDQGGKTKMTLTHVGVPAGKMTELTGSGWKESFEKMAESVS